MSLSQEQWDSIQVGDRLLWKHDGFSNEYWVVIEYRINGWYCIDAVDGFGGILREEDAFQFKLIPKGEELKIKRRKKDER